MAQPQIKQDPSVKRDPDAIGSPASFAGIDAFEDAGDLEFRDNDPRFKHVYLARVPKYVWDQWEHLGEDEEITLGTLRQSWTVKPNGEQDSKLSMLLNADVPAHQTIPKEYKLDITETQCKNTYFFTEQDLPGFKSRTNKGFDEKTANLPARLVKKVDRPGAKEPYDPKRRFQPYFRRAVPKKTTLVGGISVELNMTPVNNAETNQILAQRTHVAMRPKAQTQRVRGTDMVRGFIQPGTIQAQNAFGGFIKNTTAEKKAKAQEQKSARLPKNELYDALFRCFRKYRFWSMKSLRAELRQPEAWLRELLDEIADMPKSGRYAMKWTLKPQYQNVNVAADEEEAPDNEDTDMGDDEEGDDVQFEDVPPAA